MEQANSIDKVAELRFASSEKIALAHGNVRRAMTARDLQVAAYGLKAQAEELYQAAKALNEETKP